MNAFATIFLCFQICLIQTVYTQCAGPYRPAPAYGPGLPPYGGPALPPGYGNPAAATGYSGPLNYGAIGCGLDVAAYGGSGVGNLAVAGELPVGGTAFVGGQVPIIGAVEFGGPAAAAGAVIITGSCGCGCGAPYVY